MKVTRTERGWPGHFICASRCFFRRNTLLQAGQKRVVVSTVGSMRANNESDQLESIGYGGSVLEARFYETMAFGTKKEGPYWEANVSRKLDIEGEWAICAKSAKELPADADSKADQMHEAAVSEWTKKLEDK